MRVSFSEEYRVEQYEQDLIALTKQFADEDDAVDSMTPEEVVVFDNALNNLKFEWFIST